MRNLKDQAINDAIVINDTLEAYLSVKLAEAATISPHYHKLWQEIARILNAGGKRIRSKAAILAYRMYGGTDVQAVAPIAAALELLHQGMLMHDDIIDRDYMRYGVDNIAGSYRKHYSLLARARSDQLHHATSASLLAGDLMLSEAYGLIATAKIDAVTAIELQQLLREAVFAAVGGELMDVESAFRDKGRPDPQLVALYKTASYTTTLPLLIGARLAGAPTGEEGKLRDLGGSLGIGFQMRDDVLGIFGDIEKTGKTNNGDIREGKYTYMVQQFKLRAPKQDLSEFNSYYGKQTVTALETDRVRELLELSGALKATEQQIDDYINKASATASALAAESGYRALLRDFFEINNN